MPGLLEPGHPSLRARAWASGEAQRSVCLFLSLRTWGCPQALPWPPRCSHPAASLEQERVCRPPRIRSSGSGRVMTVVFPQSPTPGFSLGASSRMRVSSASAWGDG